MFGRRKTTTAASPVQDHLARPGAKNRPTPSRRQQESSRKRPLVPVDRKAAAKQARLAARDARVKARQALLSGDEAHLPARDRGPVRRFIRDYVDSRWNVGEFLLPVMLVVLLMSFVRQSWAQLFVFLAVYGLILVGVVDAALMWRRIRKAVVAKFGEDPAKGSAMYALMRAFQLRRSRLPKPQVPRGAKIG